MATALDVIRDVGRRYASIRQQSLEIAAPLSAEDCCVQTMPDVSPTKWHLAHTTWFFESFVLDGRLEGYSLYAPAFQVLFNSYYEGYGPQHPRPRRGTLSRPSLGEVLAYRDQVDAGMRELLGQAEQDEGLAALVELGLQHEQQHQELMLMDIKHVLGTNPLRPAYFDAPRREARDVPPLDWLEFAGGETTIGCDDEGFAFDNERPPHRRLVLPFALGRRLVTSGEWLEFIEDGGYRRVELWLADGWSWVQSEGIDAPLYWQCEDGRWRRYALGGLDDVDPAEPVCHVSYYEADAYARWAGARLPREEEWECAVRAQSGETPRPGEGNFVENGELHTRPASGGPGLLQAFGDVWEWTQSPYVPYPGFRPFHGYAAEYNGKFMCNQLVLRGGSAVTPREHVRTTYRNFFYPHQRWAFSGLRLAKDLDR